MARDLTKELSSVQREAVIYTAGPSLVIAGAGSGKTRVLTYKIAHLIKSGMPANRIMALTFTNKAAAEMKDRIDSLLGYAASKSLWMGTFHSLFGRILRMEAQSLGFTSNFTIYDTTDSVNLVKFIIKELDLNPDFYKPKVIYNRISKSKNDLVTAEAYAQKNDSLIEDEKENRPEFAKIFKIYTHRCRQSNVMDFDDLLLYANILFKLNPAVLNKYCDRFDYVLVDEYQDTNFAQYLIVKKLSEKHRKLFVVGDDAQSIYSFRGAKIQNILNFKNDYPDYKLFKLEQNYRSTQNIVNAANSLIKCNKNQIPKTVFSEKEQGTKILIEKSMTDTLEGLTVSETITDMCNNQHYHYSDFAILYRTNAQSRVLEETMRKFNIPYRVYGGLSFYQRKEIKDVIAYLRFAVNHNDIEAFRRIVNFPARKIGATTVNKILKFSNDSNIPVWDLISDPHNYNLNINSGTADKLISFANLIDSFTPKIETLNAYDFTVEIVNKSGLNTELFMDKTPEGVSRYENIQELLSGVRDFCENREKDSVITGLSILDYLENVSLLTNQDIEEDDNVERVSMMTIHSAKGLEFTNVFIVGVEENILPNSMTLFSPDEVEEERRLFYVAITRAKENLIITYSVSRFRFGDITSMTYSRFIDELDPQFIEWLEKPEPQSQSLSFDDELKKYADVVYQKPIRKIEKKLIKQEKPLKPKNLVSVKEIDKQLASAGVVPIKLDDYRQGIKVKHKSFGEGEIIELLGELPDIKAVIQFENEVFKTILLKYAKLEILQ
ncbi:MAG: 3'-5' exonuclease [Bacteroidales bacterium]|nr:3'-5' exonuclease [Bacteroidales bacterium]MDD4217050.1 3'-5' exonuclease [Bacteroidales bacterium]MDY0142672.1 3'-5' exonuclease [Bacteroidales bacterium]